MRSSGSERCCYGHRFYAVERFCIAGEDGRQGRILSVRQDYDQVALNNILSCSRVDVTDAKAIEKATQDVVKDFGDISGW